jgi:hypothetical protein
MREFEGRQKGEGSVPSISKMDEESGPSTSKTDEGSGPSKKEESGPSTSKTTKSTTKRVSPTKKPISLRQKVFYNCRFNQRKIYLAGQKGKFFGTGDRAKHEQNSKTTD